MTNNTNDLPNKDGLESGIKPSNKTFKEKQKIVNNIRAFVTTVDPALHGILTFIQHSVVKEDSSFYNTIAFTNGDRIFFGDQFFFLDRPFQAGILLHEMFHIVFRHTTRSRKRFFKLWNVATDAIINESIGLKKDQPFRPNINWYIDDDVCVTLESVFDIVDANSETRSKPISEWTSEQLYELLLNNLKDQLEKEAKKGEGEREGEGEGKGSSGSGNSNSKRRDTPLGDLEKKIDELLDKLSEKHQGMPGNDIHPGEGEPEDETGEIGDAVWTERFNRAKSMGHGTSSILGKVNDVYKPQIPWNKELRRYLNVRCMPQLTSTMTRPGRRMLSMPSVRTYLPGLEKQKGLDKMMVIIDTSGSCFNQEELTMFCSEIESIQNTTGVELALIFADTEIKSEFIVKATDGVSLIDKMKKGLVVAKGGGGTDMVAPFLEGKQKYKPNVVVIASDGGTPFPTASQVGRTNLIWVINTEAKVPRTAGRALYIKQQ